MQTVRHFFPDFNRWCDEVRDGRDQDLIIYPRRFLIWWGLSLYLFQLGSRRQLDFDLDRRGTHVLHNLNRLAQTEQTTRPVHDTLDYFLGKSSPAALAALRTRLIRRLLRMKVLDSARLLGHLPVVLDGTGHLSFSRQHCDDCLVRKHGDTVVYSHQLLEAKLLGPAGVTLSCASAFIDNATTGYAPARHAKANETKTDAVKQDCELKAFDRLTPELARVFPQAHLCVIGDALFACGRALQICHDHDWRFLFTFKEGRLPSLWQDFQGLLKLCPRQVVRVDLPDGTRQEYRWVNDLTHTDDQRRAWTVHAVLLVETLPDGTRTTFAWITDLEVNRDTVVPIAQGGRSRWCIENQGFNRQKNSGLNLGHVFSLDPENLKAYYYLMQIAHILLQLLECGSLLRTLAAKYDRTMLQLFGSLKNIARRLLECIRYFAIADASFGTDSAARLRISLDTS